MKTIHVAAAMIAKDHKILATQRGYGEFKDGWEFPGGKIEPHESAEEAIVREIQEELNVVIDPTAKVCTVEYDYPNFHLSMECFYCTIKSGKMELLEHENARWIEPSEFSEIHWLPADVQAAKDLQAYLASHQL